MVDSLVVTLREGTEAAILLAAIFSYLKRGQFRRLWGYAWGGVVAALAVSAGAGIALYRLLGGLHGTTAVIVSSGSMLLAVGVLTWAMFFMRAQAIERRVDLRQRVNAAAEAGSLLGVSALTFLIVVREGLETVLFSLAGMATVARPALVPLGAAFGALGAFLIGYAVYKGSHRIPLRSFFNLVSAVFILIATFMLSEGIEELGKIVPVAKAVPSVAALLYLVCVSVAYYRPLGRKVA